MVVSNQTMLSSTAHLEAQHCVARALYDNIAESPDELAFRKGDVLSVLEQNTGGIEGWWLCSLRGRQGICPGNRLRILPGVYQVADAEINLQNLGKRRSWHAQPNMVLTPQKFGDIYLYDLPPGQAVPCADFPKDTLLQAYDVPRPVSSDSTDILLSPEKRDFSEDARQWYDTPRAVGVTPLTPSSSASSLTAPESLSLPSSNRSSLLSGPEYDVPKSRPLPVIPQQLYDTPSSHAKQKELPLELPSALDTLNRLQAEATGAVDKLLAFVTPSWRSPHILSNTALEIKLTALRLRSGLHELAEFSEGALGNAQRAADAGLAVKLAPLTRALNDNDRSVQEACFKLDSVDWSAESLSRELDLDAPSDSLDELVAVARSLTEDIRRTTSFLQGNAPLLFRKGKQKQTAENEYSSPEWGNCDDVKLRNYEETLKTTDTDDDQLLRFYASLTLNHISHLTEAIDAFLLTVEHNQPPKQFLAHGKLVVLSAHRLVHVGDTVARNVNQAHIKQRVQEQADSLSHALDVTVQRTKRAAQNFPNVAAVQDMVDSVVDVSHFASDLRRSLVYG